MPKVSKDSAAIQEDHGAVVACSEDVAGHTIDFVTFNADIDATPLAAVVDEIERLAAERGVGVKGSELVGLMPARVAAAAAGTALRLSGFGADRLLEVASGGEFGEG